MRSPVKNSSADINGNSPFLKVVQGLFQISVCIGTTNTSFSDSLFCDSQILLKASTFTEVV